jgi:hypothetical protein
MLGYRARATEAMMYHFFPGTLVKKANKWFKRLLAKSIYSFP